VKASLICRLLGLGFSVLFILLFIFIQFEGSSYHDGTNEDFKKPHMSFTRMNISTRTKKISRKLSNRLRPLFAARSIVANLVLVLLAVEILLAVSGRFRFSHSELQLT